ncbi:MAG: benzoate-CoA ligase family protein [Candidatus Eremiobacteraeota bacterium]|nr:benzoate-CoA ligase family protein [Candidatus Eremiobacteraeota bacterium]
MEPSVFEDTFARDNLPPEHEWPEFLPAKPPLHYSRRLNAAAAFLDANVARGFGERPAIVTPARRLSYAELLAEANRVAGVLRDDLRLQTGSRVLLHGSNDATTAACWFGILKAGCIAVTTMPLLRAKELTDVISQARVCAALADARLAPELSTAAARCPELAQIVWFGETGPTDSLERRAQSRPAAFDNADTAADDVALIAFTSGTTGKPKATMHFHRDVLAICDAFPPAHLHTTPDDVFCGTPPLGFTFGLGALLLFPLRAGACAVLLESAPPDVLLDAIARYGATICSTSPTAYRAMTPLASSHDLRSLRTCVSAGEALPAATRLTWETATGTRIVDGIGATEMLHIFISASGDGVRPGATGKPVPGYVAAVLDEDGRALPPGSAGRLAVKGPTGCRYLADERQRQYVQNGWNVTGDAYLMDEDGYYWYQARTDDMIVSSGYNIAGPEVEDALLVHEAVEECAVVGAPDDERGTIVKAFVVLRDGFARDAATVRTLQDHAKTAIAPYKYPRAIEFVDALPRTETGKLQRFKLRAGNAPGGRP